MTTFVEVTHDQYVSTLTINRPDKLNAFTHVIRDELVDAFSAADADDAVRAAFTAWESRLAGRLAADFSAVARYAGIEMLRRTIGAARVAAVETPAAGLAVLADAVAWLRHPPAAP